jgi:triosephosphate isomerase
MSYPRLALFSTKAYFDLATTQQWLAYVRSQPLAAYRHVRIAFLPSLPLIPLASKQLAGTAIEVGAQTCAASEDGKQTGEVRASLLAQLGCTMVCVGHAERRANFGETDEVVRRKAELITSAGITPLICVGDHHRNSVQGAIEEVVGQACSALAGCRGADAIIAYEPVWAIGADEPAPAEFVAAVASGLRNALATDVGKRQIVYGGTAGLGIARELGESVDGLFVGRRAHDPREFCRIVAEIATDEQVSPAGARRTSNLDAGY